MDHAMRLRGMIFQSLCGRSAARSLGDNGAIRLIHSSSCLSLEAQAKLLDLVSLMRKEIEAPKICSYSNDELLRVRNKDMISLLDIFETVLDDKECQGQHHTKKVELSKKSKKIKEPCNHKVAARRIVSECYANIKLDIWKKRIVDTEATVRRLGSPFLSEDLLFGTDSQSDAVVDGLNTVDSTLEIETRKHLKKFETYLEKEPSIRFDSDYRTILADRKVAKFKKVLKADDILGCVLYRIYQLTVMEQLRREKDYMIHLLKDLDHIKYSEYWLFKRDHKPIDHMLEVYRCDMMNSNYLIRAVMLYFTRIPFEYLSKPLPKEFKAEMLLDIMKRYLSINAKIPKLLPRLSNDEMLREIRLLTPMSFPPLSMLRLSKLMRCPPVERVGIF